MFTIWGRHQPHCDGISRRNFLQIGAFGTVTLAHLLRARATAGETRVLTHVGSPTSTPKAAIMIYLPGGPSHMDMYDLKPDAPKEFRGEFNPIATNVPGVQICEHMPRQAAMWDKLAVIRSIVSVDEHSDSLVMTGYSENQNRNVGHPSFGSVVSKIRHSQGNDVPPFVSLRGMSRGTEPGYLGVAHRPFTPDGQGLRNLRLADGVHVDRMNDRQDLLGKLDSARREIDATGTMKGMDSFSTRAFDMIATGVVRKALDLSKEPPKSRDRYPRQLEPFLTARRLIEAGVGCVTLSYGGWDTHGANFRTLKKQLPELDRGVSALIQDLHDRGMDQDVITIVWGEFGRTPKINNSDGGGRDHWAPVMSAMIAGGGLKMGQAIGATTARGEIPKDRRYTAPQVLATFYTAMGIDPAMTFNNGSGRPMHILDDRNLVTELL